jgi:hypothetical protein
MTMTVSRVQDLAGNALVGSLSWSFVMQDFGVTEASVQISGLKLNLPFNINFTMPNNTLITNVTNTIAEVLAVSASRLSNVVISQAMDGNTLVSMVILPSRGSPSLRRDTATATEVLSALSQLTSASNSIFKQSAVCTFFFTCYLAVAVAVVVVVVVVVVVIVFVVVC